MIRGGKEATNLTNSTNEAEAIGHGCDGWDGFLPDWGENLWRCGGLDLSFPANPLKSVSSVESVFLCCLIATFFPA
jgi:hypothetical protein